MMSTYASITNSDTNLLEMFDDVVGEGCHHVENVVVELFWKAMLPRGIQGASRRKVFNHGLRAR